MSHLPRLFVACILLVSSWLSAAPPTATIPRGPMRGTPLDTRDIRTLAAVSPEEDAKYRQHPDDIIVTDFKHEGKFWTARIPADAVKDVVLQRVMFTSMTIPLINKKVGRDYHQQLRFILKDGKEVELFPPPGSTDKPVKSKINDITYSADALGPDMGKLFDPARSFQGEYVLARQVMSTEDSWAYNVAAMRFPVEQTRIPFSEARKQKAFAEAIASSRDIGYTEMFNIFDHNCVTASHQVMDKAAPTNPQWPGAGFFRALPYFPRLNMSLRGLVARGEDLSLPSMNDEMAALKDDKPLMKRAREMTKAKIAARRAADAAAQDGQKGPSFAKGACLWAFGFGI